MQITRSANIHGGRLSLVRALAISIAFHVLLLWPAATVRQEAVPPAPMVASLRPSPAPVAPARPAVVQQRTQPPPAKSTATGAEQRETHAPDPSALTPSSATGSEPQVAPQPPEARPVVASALPASPGVDAEGLRTYRWALSGQMSRNKHYPRLAEEAGWTGKVEVRVMMKPGLANPDVRVVKSSGNPVLDEAALSMLRQAIPMTAVPPALLGQEFAVDLPVFFRSPQ